MKRPTTNPPEPQRASDANRRPDVPFLSLASFTILTGGLIHAGVILAV